MYLRPQKENITEQCEHVIAMICIRKDRNGIQVNVGDCFPVRRSRIYFSWIALFQMNQMTGL